MKCIARISLLVLCIFALVGCSEEKTAQEYIDSAKDYIDQQELDTATLELKNALLIDPNNAESRWLLGKTYYDLAKFGSAEKELLSAVRLGVDYSVIAPMLANVYLNLRNFDELQGLSIKGLPPAVSSEILARQAFGFLADSKLDQAADRVKLALLSDPHLDLALLAQARLFFTQRNFDSANKRVHILLKKAPNFSEAWDLLGDIQFINRQSSLAQKSYTKAVEFNSTNIELYAKRALTRIQLSMFAEAQQDIDYVSSLGLPVPGLNYSQGLLHYNAGKLKLAQEAFERALRTNKNYPSAQLFLGIVHLLQRNHEQAEYYGSRYLGQVPTSVQGRKLVAMIKSEQHQYAEVENLLSPIVARVGDDAAVLNLLAEAKLKLGKKKEGVALLEKVASLNQGSAAADFRLGLGYLIGGDDAVGIDHIQSALNLDPTFQQADIALVMSYLRQKNFQKAIAAAENYSVKNPQVAAPKTLLGGVYLTMGETSKAEAAFKQALELSPGDPSASHNLAGIYIRSGSLEQARGVYDKVLSVHENNLATLMLLSFLDAKEQKYGLQVEHLKAAINTHPKAVKPLALLARYYLTTGESRKVLGLLNNLKGAQKDQINLLTLLGKAQVKEGRYADALLTFENIVETHPNSAEAHFMLSTAYAGLNDADKTKRSLKKSIEISPQYIAPRLVFTRLLLKEGQLTAAQDQIAEMKQKLPKLPAIIELEAATAQKRGDNVTALNLLNGLLKDAPSTNRLLNLVRMEWEVGSQVNGIRLMESWLVNKPKDVRIRLELANAFHLLGRTKAAIEEYQQILKVDNKNIVALNNLAWSLLDVDPKGALNYANTANELQPESPNLKDTLAVILLKNGEVEKAKEAINFALDKKPDHPTFLYHGALIYEAAGAREQAVRTLVPLMDKDIEFKEKQKAEALFHRLNEK